MRDRRYLSLSDARDKGLKIDWTSFEAPKPALLGTKVFESYDVHNLIQHIDWNPFFQTWQLRGKYPNRGYPKIFKDETVGPEAKKLFDDAQDMLHTILEKRLLTAHGVVGFYPANAVGDDIQLYESEDKRNEPIATFFGLRQQAEKDSDSTEPYYCLSDFIAPKESGCIDYIGAFAVSVGFGVDEACVEFEKQHDDYSIIMLKALADRLTEAFAELLHEKVRKEYWGYAKHENLTTEEMLSVKYRGIRPAPAYPSQPDSSEKTTLFDLLKVKETTGIELTENLAMLPAASVCGIYFAHPESTYFAVGKVTKEQIVDYAKRKEMEIPEAEKWLMQNINYDTD